MNKRDATLGLLGIRAKPEEGQLLKEFQGKAIE